MNSVRFYLKVYFGILISGLLTVASFNLIVDPYNIYRLVEVPGLDRKDPSIVKSAMRRIKSIDITERNYDTLILGSSRVIQGIDPESPIFSDFSAYNAGLPRAYIYEIYHIFKYAQKNLDLKAVVLGLDFEVFLLNADRGIKDFELSKFTGNNIYLANWKNLFTWQNIEFSWKTIKSQKHDYSFVYTDKGFRKNNYFIGNYHDNFEKHTQHVFALVGGEKENLLPQKSNIKYNLKLIEKIVKDCQKNNIKLYLFISPTHAHQLEVYRILNLFSLYENWKKQLTTMTNKLSKNNSKNNYMLWGFSGYNRINTEKIQDRNMHWYWDSSHYKKKVGEMILARLLGQDASQDVSEDFGKIINIHNVESHTRNIRQEQKQYQQGFPGEVEKVEQIAREMKIRLER
ncbi:hypothetical protein [Myxosarcina sp. GI1]|uniref:hypothetical protein n=1 Tax=Myxosarcina sp. GI1 TaxID=1541065 RepID=UPI000569C0B0|nr:hypothetical protein [Myxosarcina sp. GI1]